MVCARCPAEADWLFKVFADDGSTMLERPVCRPCGEALQAETEAKNGAHCDLLRQGLDERMAKRVIDARVDRGELLPMVAEMLRDE
jgi:hypothetical protein